MAKLHAEVVAFSPAPGGVAPLCLSFCPSGRRLTFLLQGKGESHRQLYQALLPSTGALPRGFQLLLDLRRLSVHEAQGRLSLEEALARERQRNLTSGVSQYAWCSSAAGDMVLIPVHGHLWLYRNDELTELYNASARGPAIDPQMSPDGTALACVLSKEICCMQLTDFSHVVQLTSGADGEGILNGVADFLSQEEMNRYTGFWWAPDSQSILFTSVDQTAVPEYYITNLGTDVVETESHRYPFAGEANPAVKLGVVKVSKPLEIVWLRLPEGDQDVYIARAGWFPDGFVMAQVQSRDQRRLQLLRYHPESGHCQCLLEETSQFWINLHDMFHPLTRWRPGEYAEEAVYFLWASERTSFMHVYLYRLLQGECVCLKQITSGDWMVDSIKGVDEDNGILYVTGTYSSCLERHLYSIPLWDVGETSSAPAQITLAGGVHYVILNMQANVYADLHSSMSHPLLLSVHRLRSAPSEHPDEDCALLYNCSDWRCEVYGPLLQPPVQQSFVPRDGGPPLYTHIYIPDAAIHGPPPYPLVVFVYGGPTVQRVVDSWNATSNMRAQWYREQGFLVAQCDNRGSYGRGASFERYLYGNLGDIEVRDQEDLVKYLTALGLCDAENVGITGWSYGGYLSLMCLCKASQTFCCACAGAPVTSWDGYDTHYTERYMFHPHANAEGYRRSSVLTHVHRITGDLLLVHGLLDENVHFRHTARLISALTERKRNYDLIMFPTERHSPRSLTERTYLEHRMFNFFYSHLLSKKLKSFDEEATLTRGSQAVYATAAPATAPPSHL